MQLPLAPALRYASPSTTASGSQHGQQHSDVNIDVFIGRNGWLSLCNDTVVEFDPLDRPRRDLDLSKWVTKLNPVRQARRRVPSQTVAPQAYQRWLANHLSAGFPSSPDHIAISEAIALRNARELAEHMGHFDFKPGHWPIGSKYRFEPVLAHKQPNTEIHIDGLPATTLKPLAHGNYHAVVTDRSPSTTTTGRSSAQSHDSCSSDGDFRIDSDIARPTSQDDPLAAPGWRKVKNKKKRGRGSRGKRGMNTVQPDLDMVDVNQNDGGCIVEINKTDDVEVGTTGSVTSLSRHSGGPFNQSPIRSDSGKSSSKTTERKWFSDIPDEDDSGIQLELTEDNIIDADLSCFDYTLDYTKTNDAGSIASDISHTADRELIEFPGFNDGETTGCVEVDDAECAEQAEPLAPAWNSTLFSSRQRRRARDSLKAKKRFLAQYQRQTVRNKQRTNTQEVPAPRLTEVIADTGAAEHLIPRAAAEEYNDFIKKLDVPITFLTAAGEE